jgi:DNA polymerase-1
MKLCERFPEGIWFVDFEFHPAGGREGNRPVPVCMVAREYQSGQTLRLWQDELQRLSHAPFHTGNGALFVAFYASAELGCFIQLGWPLPTNVFDLHVAFSWITNGSKWSGGRSLLAALQFYGFHSIGVVEKEEMRNLVMRGGPWSADEMHDILDYCESDVLALSKLFPKVVHKQEFDRLIFYSSYHKAAAYIESVGVPIDVDVLTDLQANRDLIQQRLIEVVDKDFGVYEGTTFKIERFKALCLAHGVVWPMLPSGEWDLKKETFKRMSAIYPWLEPVYQLRKTLALLRSPELPVGTDGRNRVLSSLYRTKTSRNAPSSNRFVFGLPGWMRFLIKPPVGRALAIIDWSQQEFGIAAVLSEDQAMQSAYLADDPYMAFAILSKLSPHGATKSTHPEVRKLAKACVLGVQYGLSAQGLAFNIQAPKVYGQQLLEAHQRAFPNFWAWVDNVHNTGRYKSEIRSTFGWRMQIHPDISERTIKNFPVQTNGAEMLRLAVMRMLDHGVCVIATIHDAVAIEADICEIEEAVIRAQAAMRWASAEILNGFELRSEAKIVRYPDRFIDDDHVGMWTTVMQLLGRDQNGYRAGPTSVEHVPQADTSVCVSRTPG